MLSGYENTDIMLGGNTLEDQDEDMDRFTIASINREKSSLDNEIRDMPSSSNFYQEGQFSSNLENITGRISQKLSQEIEKLVGTVNSSINDAIEIAINERVLPMLQNTANGTINGERGINRDANLP